MIEPGARAELAARWAAAHPGHRFDESPLLRGWLAAMWRIGGPLARAGVPPSALSAAGVLSAQAAALAAARPSRSARAAALAALLASAAADGLDGSVAIHRPQWDPRTARRGALIDRSADRIVDACWAWTLRSCGAPTWAAVGLAAGSTAQELARDRLGVRAQGATTVSERPTRLICAAIGVAAAIVAPRRRWPAWVCAGVWGASAVAAAAQLRRAR